MLPLKYFCNNKLSFLPIAMEKYFCDEISNAELTNESNAIVPAIKLYNP